MSQKSNNFTIISIEGNIGSGKTTLMENLKEYYKNNSEIIFLREPVDEWSLIKDSNGVTILEKFYQDQHKYSFSFQIMAYISRLNVLRTTLKSLEQDKKYIIITERSLNTDRYVFAKMLYETSKMEEVNYQIYLTWFDTFSEEFSVHKIIYVKANSEICHMRICKRSRKGEEIIPLNYLYTCNQYHENMIEKNSQNIQYIILNGNMDIYENENLIGEWIKKINTFIL
jgi:deoxyadenosine/deoxycytidine kinase